MDKTVPAYAAIILNFIGDIEAPYGYDTIYANKQNKLSKRITKMILAELQEGQRTRWNGLVKSSASGRYQFMHATLKGLISELKLSPSQKFDANLQDRLGYHLLKRRGLDEWLAGKITNTQFGLRLAQEWASLPVLSRTPRGKGKRAAERGESYYTGDNLNKSLVTPERVEAMLEEAWAVYKKGIQKPTRSTTPEKVAVGVGTGVGGAVAVEQSGVTFEQLTSAIVQIAPLGLPVLAIAVGVGIMYFGYKKWKG